MEITLKHILPIPLKEKLIQKKSDVWNTNQTFNSKEWIKIKAPSGTGKTTLIHILYKLRLDFEGQLFWDKKNIDEINEIELATIRQQKLSVIFQDLKLFPNLTAKENIELKRVLPTPFYDENMITTMAEKLGITHILHQQTALCSYGEQQRIAIIRALIQPFELLLMDEPFSHLDKANTTIAANLIAEECTKRNAGFVLTDLDDDAHFNYTQQISL